MDCVRNMRVLWGHIAPQIKGLNETWNLGFTAGLHDFRLGRT
jgi:hypothetical protein